VVAPPLRIIYLGTPPFAVPSLEALIGSRHRVICVVSQPDRPRGRGHHVVPTATKEVALGHGIPVLQPSRMKDEAFQSAVRDLGPDLGVVAAFGRILPDSLIAIPRLGMINVHASLLPKYRGAAPIQRAVLAGEQETGVSIMRVVTELDAGPTFDMRRVRIDDDATSGDVERALAALGASALLPVVDALAEGRAAETPQDASQATFAPKVTKEEREIDWGADAMAIHNQVRGLQPWPLASTTLGSVRYVIRRTRVEPPDRQIESRAEVCGRILKAAGEEIVVACGDGTRLRILELQPEGRRVMTAREFLAGRHIAPGERFGA
jgi:methionyl-tRNA formyltransferase